MEQVREMNMDRFDEDYTRVSSNSGLEYANVPRLVVQNGLVVRLIGDYAMAWEHFVELGAGSRPYYCAGPKSDCPICDASRVLAMDEDSKKQELGGSIRAKERYYFNVLDKSPAGQVYHKQNKKSYMLTQNAKGMNIGSQLFKAIGSVVNMRKQQGQAYDPNKFDIMLMKTGSGQQTQYSAQFTGDVSPLSEEELSYEIWPVGEIAKLTPHSDRKTVADFILGRGVDPSAAATQFDVTKMGAQGPVQAAQQVAQPPKPAMAPPPATRPNQQQRINPVPQTAKPAPQQAPPPVQQQKPILKPPTNSQYADTRPKQNADMSTHMEIPCSSCGAAMLIDLNDVRQLQCYNCNQVYAHPNAS